MGSSKRPRNNPGILNHCGEDLEYAFFVDWNARLFYAFSSQQAEVAAGVKVPLEEVPEPAVKHVKERFPKATIRFVDKEGANRFEFAMKDGIRLLDVGITAEGKLLNVKEEIAEEKLPAVIKTRSEEIPRAKIVEAEKVVAGDGEKAKVIFELAIKIGNGGRDVSFDSTGKLLDEKD